MIGRAGDLARRLARDAEGVCRHYLSNGKRQGRYWVVGDVGNAPGRSLYIRLQGPEAGPGAAGKWTDAATGEHGDLLDLIGLNLNLAILRDVLDEASTFLAQPLSAPPRSPAPRGSAEAARRLFRAGRPVPGTPAESYLRARAITAPLDSAALRFHASVYYRASNDAPREVWPALLAAITDPQGHITGVLRTFLDRARPAKAPIADPRKALGDILGNGVRFGCAKDILVAGEGIETMLALKSVLPWLPMIAGLSAAHLAAFNLAPALRRLYIAPDNDTAGLKAAMRLQQRAEAAGTAVSLLVPAFDDFNADLSTLGTGPLRTMLLPQLDAADRNGV